MTSTRSKLSVAMYLGRHETPNSGLWVYSRGLVIALADLLAKKRVDGVPLYELKVFGADARLLDDLNQHLMERCGGREVEVNMTKYRLADGRRFNLIRDIFSRAPEVDVIHGTANTLPLLGTAPKRVLSLHDLLQAFPRENPTTIYLKIRTLMYRAILWLLTKSADVVVTVHPKMREEIMKRYPHVKRIEVIYSGLEKGFLETPIPRMPTREVNGEKYIILAFASRDKRKNIGSALKAFGEALESYPKGMLTVICSNGAIAADVERAAKDLKLKDFVEAKYDLSVTELVTCYAEARGVIFPSLAEGFGYPIYEALSQGVPIVCDGKLVVPELREVAEPFIFSCVPTDDRSVAKAVLSMLAASIQASSREICAEETRQILSSEGLSEKFLSIYNELGVEKVSSL